MTRNDLTSLVSDIKKVLEREAPWYLDKRSYYDPYRLLRRAELALESALDQMDELEEETLDLKRDLRNMDDELVVLENKLASGY